LAVTSRKQSDGLWPSLQASIVTLLTVAPVPEKTSQCREVLAGFFLCRNHRREGGAATSMPCQPARFSGDSPPVASPG
jgi:hypothetical protein